MAFRTSSILKTAMESLGCRLSYRSCSVVAQRAPLERTIDFATETPFLSPEFNRKPENNTRIEIPTFSFGGSMELMAVPRKKVSKHKRGIRNGPKALKPVPVIIRCKSCGRVKLPHFYCCSGDRGTPAERNDSTS